MTAIQLNNSLKGLLQIEGVKVDPLRPIQTQHICKEDKGFLVELKHARFGPSLEMSLWGASINGQKYVGFTGVITNPYKRSYGHLQLFWGPIF